MSLRLLLGLFAVLLCVAECRPPVGLRTDHPPLQREIRGGEIHVYPVELRAGQFQRVILQEEGIDVRVQLVDDAGDVITGVDGLLGGEANEDLAAVATNDGTYRVEVIAPASPNDGRYRLKVEVPREPLAQDRVLAQAVRATWDGFLAPSTEEQIRSLEQALSLWQRLGNTGKSAEVLYGLGKKLYSAQAYDQALPYLQRAAVLWSQQPGHKARVYQARSWIHVARCLRHTERRGEARAAHEQALALARDLDETGLQAENLNLLGRLDLEEGEQRRGIDRLLQALEMARKARDRNTESEILNHLAIGYEQLGEMQEALELYQNALNLALQAHNREAEVIYRNNLGAIYRSLGDWEKAFDHYRLAAEMSGDSVLHGKLLINLAAAYRHRRQLEEARDSLDRALALGRKIKSREVQVFALGNLAFLLLQLRQPAQATAYAREAAGLARSLEEETFSRYALGTALLDLGDTASARTELAKALALAGRRGDRAREAEVNLVLARMDREDGDLASALPRIESVIELIESWRGRVVDPEVRTSFLASTQNVYELLVNTLMGLAAERPADGYAADALKASEQARARGFLDFLNEAGTDIRRGVDPALIEKERQLREDMNARDWSRWELLGQNDPDHEKVTEAERKLEEARDLYRKVQVELRQGSPQYAALTQPQALNTGEIRQLLDGEALLLEYFLGAQRSFLWIVAPDSIASFELPGREEIEQSARRYYELLIARNDRRPGETLPARKRRIAQADAEAESAARDLSRLILAPAERLLGERKLLIVADGALQYIPFAALPIPATGEPLVSRHVIVNLPSASVLAALRRELRDRPRAPRALAIYADPVFEEDDRRLGKTIPVRPTPRLSEPRDAGEASREDDPDLANFRRLPYSQKEADAIAALLPPEEVFKAVGFAASRAAVTRGRLVDYRNVHFATHGVLDSRRPELSGLALSFYDERGEREDGFLRLNDVYDLRLNADLVVLSACRTALGKEIRGEGLVGLTRGFMYAGAARVLASLWSVEDRATSELMESFYRGMLRDGLSAAAALRQAQLEMAGKPERRSPYYWAGFSLQGEWR